MAAARDKPLGVPTAARFATFPTVVLRGQNRLAELEALVVLGGGRFEVGVNYVVTHFRTNVPLAAHHGEPLPAPFPERTDEKLWSLKVYEQDAYVLRRQESAVSLSLSHMFAAAWPHVPQTWREKIAARLDELPPDGMSAAWKAAGGLGYWKPPQSRAQQTHFLDGDGASWLGVLR